MRLRSVVVVIVLGALACAAACTAFGSDPGPGTTTTGDAGAGSTSSGGEGGDGFDGGGGSNDAGTTPHAPPPVAVAIDGGALTQAEIGTPCTGRVPPWRLCLDFNTGDAGPARVVDAGGSLGVEENVLVARTSSGGYAYVPVAIPDNSDRVVWSFDVRIDGDVLNGTEFGTLDLPIGGKDYCSVKIDRSGDKIRVLEYCRISAEITEGLLAALSLPNQGGWFNLLVDANLGTKKVDAYLRSSSGVVKPGSGTLGKALPAKDAMVHFGIAYVNDTSHVDIDNAVVWWPKAK